MKKYFLLGFWKKLLGGTSTRKRLTENFFSLLILQVLNYLLPLITLPYLVRVLGPEKYGLVSFAQAFIGYFIVLTDYGFNLSATREISINRENREKVNKIFSSVIVIKLIIGMLSFIILISVLVFIPKFRSDWLIYIFTFGMVLGNILFPVWFFQGMERMKYIAILNIISKIIFTICIFIFIKETNDYIYFPLINSLGYLTAGVLSLVVAFKNFGLKFIKPDAKSIKYQLKEGWHIFISIVSVSLYTTSNAFILGLFTNNTIVGYYSAAEKIIQAAKGLLIPISQTVYPYINKLASKSKKKALNLIRKLAIFTGSGSFIISLILFIFAKLIINLLLGSQYQQSIIILKILAFLPVILAFTNVFGAQLLLPFNIKRLFTYSIVIPSIIHVILLLIITPIYKEIGVASIWVFTEFSILIFRIIGIYLFHKDIFKGIYYGKR